MSDIPLAEFVAGLQAELRGAQVSQNSSAQFTLGPVSIEVTVGATRENAPRGRVRFWVVKPGTSTQWSSEELHKVSLTLTPVTRTPADDDRSAEHPTVVARSLGPREKP